MLEVCIWYDYTHRILSAENRDRRMHSKEYKLGLVKQHFLSYRTGLNSEHFNSFVFYSLYSVEVIPGRMSCIQLVNRLNNTSNSPTTHKLSNFSCLSQLLRIGLSYLVVPAREATSLAGRYDNNMPELPLSLSQDLWIRLLKPIYSFSWPMRTTPCIYKSISFIHNCIT